MTHSLSLRNTFTKELNQIGFTAYPNPVASILYIDAHEMENAYSISVVNMNGVILEELSQLSGKSSVDFSTYPNGVYFVMVVGESGQIQVFKIVR
jgi:hypothetical protein